MMVIVVDTILIASRGSFGLDATKKTIGDQHSKRVVHRLARDGADIRQDKISDLVRRDVWITRDCPQHREALGRRLNAVLTQLVENAFAVDTHCPRE